MKTATTGDYSKEYHRLEWPSPEGANQRVDADAAIDALFTLIDGWLEILALEVRVGCYDRETYTEASELRPPQPYHLLVHEPRPSGVSIDRMYRSVESPQVEVTRVVAGLWLDKILSQSCGDTGRYETSLREIDILASRTALPSGWSGEETLALECYAGTVTIPVQRGEGGGVVMAPPAGYVVRQPVVISIENDDGALYLTVEVYWSPWVGELMRSGGSLAKGVALLESRGWRQSSD